MATYPVSKKKKKYITFKKYFDKDRNISYDQYKCNQQKISEYNILMFILPLSFLRKVHNLTELHKI